MKGSGIYLCIGSAAAAAIVFSDWNFQFVCTAAPLFLFCYLRIPQVSLKIIYLILILLILIRTELIEQLNISKMDSDTTSVSAIIKSAPLRNGDNVKWTAETKSGEKIIISLNLQKKEEIEQLNQFMPGIECNWKGKLEKPIPAVNFRAFSYMDYLHQHQIHWVFQAESLDHGSCAIKDSKISQLKEKLLIWRHFGVDWIESNFPVPLQGISAALIFGDRQLLEPETEISYQSLGIIHLLAVSGMHVGLITGCILIILLRAGFTKENAAVVLICFLPIYIILAGAAPSVVRAGGMAIIFMVIYRFRLNSRHAVDVLAFTCIVMLLCNPYYLLQVGFQLSFIVSLCLMFSSKLILKSNIPMSLIIVTTLAQLASLPIILYHFHEFSLLSFLLNLLFIPLITIIVLPASFLLFFISLISLPLADLWLQPLADLMDALHLGLNRIRQTRFLQVPAGQPAAPMIMIMSFSILYVFKSSERKGKLCTYALSIVTASLLLQIFLPYTDNKAYVTFLDVGQGDSIVIELPYRKAVYVIDGGGALTFPKEKWAERDKLYDPGEQIVVPFLKSRGIREIDTVIVTHGDADHYGGVPAVTRETKVRKILYGRSEKFESKEIKFLAEMSNRGIPVFETGDGDAWLEDGHQFKVLAPEGTESSGNARSIVLAAEIKGKSFLFTGDIEEQEETQLLKRYPYIQADYVKVAHHGSSTSSSEAFLDQIGAKTAFISAGRCNRFGHPGEDVLSKLDSRNIKVFQTKEQGAVRLTIRADDKVSINAAVPAGVQYECK
ncbi:DNA internalization-related competence protein ComEC/Rec2 [Alteribacillus sp. HJP-4]|uniref:DNA internalization-related competence protein ComEC/Rec2 n=1 Tax=Alteribacillus sp. HJP-4 TaxID=2775394 RepID=UPI0035CCF5E9